MVGSFFVPFIERVIGQNGLEFVTRSEWGARDPRCAESWEQCGKAPLKLPVPYVFIHHTGGSMPPTRNKEIATLKRLQNLAMGPQGKADISYNSCVAPSGRIYEGRGWNTVGYATPLSNFISISICFLGNFQKDVPTEESLSACRQLLAKGVQEGFLTPDFELLGHRDAKKLHPTKKVRATACPGKNLYEQLEALSPR